MKAKITVGLTLTLVLIITLFIAIPVRAQRPTIKVGIIGPIGLPHWSPAGMKEGAELARDEINVAGVNVGGTLYDIELVYGNEYAITGPGGTPEPEKARMEVVKLITVDGVKFIMGGFRTEVVGPMIEMAMDYQAPFLINGASTDELISTKVPVDYARYKYLFRVNPVNSTILFRSIAAYLGGYVIPRILLPIYGAKLWPAAPVPQVKVAVLTEDLAWTLGMHYLLTLPPGVDPRYPAGYQTFLSPYANVTYSARVPATATDLTSWLSWVIESEARLMIHVFSGGAGLPLIIQWKDMGVKALPVGINVMGQLDTHWASTFGKCEGEAFLDFSGTRTPIVPGVTTVFWDTFVARTGRWPIYTAWGAYSGLYILRDAIQRAGTLSADGVVTELEKTDAKAGIDPGAIQGNFKFTSTHDVYSAEYGVTWTKGYVRAAVVQWQAGRKEVVNPIDKTYSRRLALPSWGMYPYPTDVAGLYGQDGKVDSLDIVTVSYAYGSTPGHARWQFLTDVDRNWFIDTNDLSAVSYDFLREVQLPLPYCSEANRWKT